MSIFYTVVYRFFFTVFYPSKMIPDFVFLYLSLSFYYFIPQACRDQTGSHVSIIGKRDDAFAKRTQQHTCDLCCHDDLCNRNCLTASNIPGMILLLCLCKYFKVTLNKFHKTRNSDISLIKIGFHIGSKSYFGVQTTEMRFISIKDGQPHCGEIGSTIYVCMRNSAFRSSVHQ
jgi:hypothetical protein